MCRKVSDDTVLHLATAEGLIEAGRTEDTDEINRIVAKHCKRGMRDMAGRCVGGERQPMCHPSLLVGVTDGLPFCFHIDRAPGNTTIRQFSAVGSEGQRWNETRFNPRGGGCGAAMRSMCIGLRFPAADQQRKLLEVALETGRTSHHNAIGYGGSIAGALFTALALRNGPPVVWGTELLRCDRTVRELLENSGRDVAENLESWDQFMGIWRRYLDSVCVPSLESSLRVAGIGSQ